MDQRNVQALVRLIERIDRIENGNVDRIGQRVHDRGAIRPIIIVIPMREEGFLVPIAFEQAEKVSREMKKGQ